MTRNDTSARSNGGPPSQAALDLEAAFGQPGCCVCRLLARDERRYWEALLYEQVNDPGLRDALRAARGYCAIHAHALAATPGAPLAIAIIANDILATVREALVDHPETRATGPLALLRSAIGGDAEPDALVGALRGTRPCPACVHLNSLAEMYVETLVFHLERDDAYAAYRQSAGVCLPHVLLAARVARASQGLERLVAQQQAVLDQLGHELGEFIRKHDYRFHAEGIAEDESDVWRRALDLLSGNRHGQQEYSVHDAS